MSTEKLHFFKSNNIWIHRAHILHNNITFFAIGFMKATPEPKGTRMPVIWNITFDIGLLTPLSPLTPFPLPWEATHLEFCRYSGSFAIQCQAQNGGMDKLLRRLYPLHSCKKYLLGQGWVHSRSQLRQNTKHFYDPVHPYCTTPREPPQIIYSCLVDRTSKHSNYKLNRARSFRFIHKQDFRFKRGGK